MNVILRYFVFVVIGIIPVALANYNITDWQWWATCVPLCAGIAFRDIGNDMAV